MENARPEGLSKERMRELLLGLIEDLSRQLPEQPAQWPSCAHVKLAYYDAGILTSFHLPREPHEDIAETVQRMGNHMRSIRQHSHVESLLVEVYQPGLIQLHLCDIEGRKSVGVEITGCGPRKLGSGTAWIWQALERGLKHGLQPAFERIGASPN